MHAPAARRGDRTLPVAERLRRVAGRRVVTDELRERLHAYAEKAIREAATAHHLERPRRPSSSRPCTPGSTTSSTARSAAEMSVLVAQLDEHARSDCAGPEAAVADRARRPRRLPGHRAVGRQPRRPRQPPAGRLRGAARGACGRSSDPKIRVVTAALHFARASARTPSCPAATGPCSPTGSAREHVVAFLRGDDVLVAGQPVDRPACRNRLGRHVARPARRRLDRPARPAGRFTGRVAAAELFAELPVALLERTRA